jgi:integrase
MAGELTYKIILKDYVNAAGRSRLYLQCFKNKSRKLIPLTIEVSPDIWDKTAQECRGRTRDVKDINLQINQIKGRINEILVRARLQNKSLSLEEFNNRFLNPLPEYDFIAYYEYQLIARKDLLAVGTWKNQKSTLAKLKEFKEHIPFEDLSLQFVSHFKAWMEKKKGNGVNTVHTALKNLKTYLNLAFRLDEINLPFDPNQIKVKKANTERPYLTLDQLDVMHEYYESKFCPLTHKNTLQPFLFACYTGLRYGDLESITRENIIENRLAFTPRKTKKHAKVVVMKLSKKALRYINPTGKLFDMVYTNQNGNQYLKEIARQCKITRRLSWHVARHTFATSFLTLGGSVDVLQSFLGHSSIAQTMQYTHIIDSRKDEQIDLFDK